MAKRLSEKEKKEIIKCFTLGETLEELAYKFNCSKLTISRNIKKNVGEKRYKELIQSKSSKHSPERRGTDISFGNKDELDKNFDNENIIEENSEEQFFASSFMEITPLDYEIETTTQKDLSSVPISDISFPKVVYMIVDKKIELETKFLKDYPEWQFLSKEELQRKTIQIFFDLKIAKKFCNNDKKVIKVPNSEVFKIVAPILISKGISRIVSDDKLIAL